MKMNMKMNLNMNMNMNMNIAAIHQYEYSRPFSEQNWLVLNMPFFRPLNQYFVHKFHKMAIQFCKYS